MPVESVREDIAAWIVDRLKSEVPTFNDVELVAQPDDFGILVPNAPSAAVIISAGTNSDISTPRNDDYLYLTCQVFFSVPGFAAGQGLTGRGNLYALLDDIHTALGWVTPTTAHEPLRYRNDGPAFEGIADGLVLWMVEYRTALTITGGL